MTVVNNFSVDLGIEPQLLVVLYEPYHEKTGFLAKRKQRRRSAPLFSLH